MARCEGIRCGAVYTPSECLRDCGIAFAHGRIDEITAKRDEGFLDASDCIVIPGLIDIQVNGALSYGFQLGDRVHFGEIIAHHLRAGTTTLLPTLVTADEHTLATSLSALADVIEQPASATLAGIHLEGPFLAPSKRGAHDEGALRLPFPDLVNRLSDAARGHLRVVTLAPELPGSLEAIAYLARHGIVVAAGHSAATLDQMRAAVDAGLSLVTHAGNASDWPHRAPNALGFMGSEPGVVGALLALSTLRGSVIMDGFHLHPALLRPMLQVKGTNSLILISDASTVAGCPPGAYERGGLSALVDARGFAISQRGGNWLAGSTITLLAAVQRAVALAQLSVQEAVTLATLTPAKMLGIDDRKGAIRIGADADLLVLDQDLNLRHVIVGGTMIVS